MDPAERNAKDRAEIQAAFEDLCPGIIGNPFIPHWPTAKQILFLRYHQSQRDDSERPFECLYGGAAGGGKSDALLMAASQHVKDPEFSGVLFRRTHAEHKLAGALADRAMEWWIPAGAHWNGSDMIFTFPSGAKVAMGYMSNPNDHLRYQSAHFHFSGWDELTHWPNSSQYTYVGRSRIRRREGCTIPLRTLCASNPGGPGHTWVRDMFIGGLDPVTGEAIEPEHPYLPATIKDNPHLDQDAYIASLMHLHPTVREQLLNGDWRARDPGDYFQAQWFGPLLDPEKDLWPATECTRVRWWDLAASEKPDAARTAGVKMARHRRGVRAIEHCRVFRATPGKRDDLIVQTAKADGRHVIVGIEIEGGSGGPAQFEALQTRLRALGFRVSGARPKAELTDTEGKRMMRNPTHDRGKEARADPVASCLERGHQRRGECPNTGGPWWGLDAGRHVQSQRDGIRLFAGPWTQGYLDEVEGFPEVDLKDIVDATSGAWAYLESHGSMGPPPIQRKDAQPAGDMADIHPADRPDPADRGKDRGGHWRP